MSTPTTTGDAGTRPQAPTGAGVPAAGRDVAALPDRTAWRLVAGREVAVKLRDRTFVLSTAFMVVLLVGVIAFSSFMSGRTSSYEVAVVEPAARQVVEDADDGADDGAGDGADDGAGDRADDGAGARFTTRDVADAAEAQRLLAEGEVDLALLAVDGTPDDPAARWELVGQDEVPSQAGRPLAEAVADAELAANAADLGAEPATLLAGTVLGERVVQPGDLDEDLRYLLAAAFGFLFYVTALTFGIAIAQSVIEEKQSRVVEILAATVPIRQLLWGKVVGNSALAIGQVVLLASTGLAGLALAGQGEVLSLVLAASLWFVVFFLLGFAALACVWAVAGSVATRQEDLQATTMPVQVLVLAALFVGITGSGDVLTVGSYVPLVSSVAMPVRMLSEDVPLWQPLLSAGLVVATAVLLVRLGARVYENSLLRTDRRTSVREALRAGDA
ncbi:ABC transporter permease [Thalassiella azotivora]